MAAQQGVAGLPVPYSISDDNVMILPLVVGFCIVVALVGYYRNFLVRQYKLFVYGANGGFAVGKTKEERFMLLLLMLSTCMMMAYAVCFHLAYHDAFAFSSHSLSVAIATFSASFVAYYLVKWLLYMLVNQTFFGGKKTLQWNEVFQQLIAFQGLLLLPVVVVQALSGVSWTFSLFATAFILILNKILSFYKAYRIFFKGNDGLVQNFLYFCALEITPLLALAAVMQMEIDNIKIKI